MWASGNSPYQAKGRAWSVPSASLAKKTIKARKLIVAPLAPTITPFTPAVTPIAPAVVPVPTAGQLDTTLV